uniref:Uncharacterized protein n=1 Tax=Avena sativa TaxID=4498 RepID=A0ACD5YRM4_AVESA
MAQTIETDEEENSYDKNDAMSDDDVCVSGHIDISDDGNSAGTDGGVSQRGIKRQKGMKVGPKVIVESSAKCKSVVWEHFDKVPRPSKEDPTVEVIMAQCKYCKKFFSYNKDNGGATSHLLRHYSKACPDYKVAMAKVASQTLLNFQPSNASDTGIPVLQSSREYSQEEAKKLIAKMLICHDYPFKMVEHTWFNIVMKYLNPRYEFIGRKTIRKECMKVFESERDSLMKVLKGVDNIALTTDLWTSNQTLSYMCLVAHFIDKDWNMQCRVLNFVELDPPHSGNVISQAVFECVAAWKIEGKIISITLDNAANNDVAIRNLKAMFAARSSYCFVPKYFHVRFCAHIINLVVTDGTATITPLTINVRESVKYIKKSVSRLHKFVEICRSLAITVGEGLKLDVTTRWNSTYHMLRTAIAYRDALDSYSDSDANYKWKPSNDEWALFNTVTPILASLAEVSTAFSGSTYPTSNIFYPHIVNVKIALKEACDSKNPPLKVMGEAMMDKFNKYWEEPNNVMVIATILDPRYKLKYIKWGFRMIYEQGKALAEYNLIDIELTKLYETYDMHHRHEKADSYRSGASSSSTVDISSSLPSSASQFTSYLNETSLETSKNELLKYLDEENESLLNKKFDVLLWWRLNAHRYHVIAKMAKNFLSIPATSVSSESTFSTGGQVLDDYRRSLKPAMVEALVCASSWIKGAHNDNKVSLGPEPDDADDVEFIPFPKSMVGSN